MWRGLALSGKEASQLSRSHVCKE